MEKGGRSLLVGDFSLSYVKKKRRKEKKTMEKKRRQESAGR